MSENESAETTETVNEATESAEPAGEKQPKPTETVEFWKQKAREQEARAKANAKAAERLTELEESQKSEAEKLSDRAAAAEAEAEKARAEALRWRTAAKHGISDEDAELFLTGTDEETLTRQAERLAARSVPPKGTYVPGAGTEPGTPPPLDAQIRAAEEKGDFGAAMALKSQKLAELAKQN